MGRRDECPGLFITYGEPKVKEVCQIRRGDEKEDARHTT